MNETTLKLKEYWENYTVLLVTLVAALVFSASTIKDSKMNNKAKIIMLSGTALISAFAVAANISDIKRRREKKLYKYIQQELPFTLKATHKNLHIHKKSEIFQQIMADVWTNLSDDDKAKIQEALDNRKIAFNAKNKKLKERFLDARLYDRVPARIILRTLTDHPEIVENAMNKTKVSDFTATSAMFNSVNQNQK